LRMTLVRMTGSLAGVTGRTERGRKMNNPTDSDLLGVAAVTFKGLTELDLAVTLRAIYQREPLNDACKRGLRECLCSAANSTLGELHYRFIDLLMALDAKIKD